MLLTLLAIPTLAVIFLIMVPAANALLLRSVAIVASVTTLCVAIAATLNLDPNGSFIQYEVQVPWIGPLGATFHIGLDGLGVLMTLLTALAFPAALLFVNNITTRMKEYTILMMALEASLLGLYMSLDLVLFYFFWEGVLIPTYFLIGVWGGERRIYAALKYVLYTMVGSLLMLVGVLATAYYFHANAGAPVTFDLLTLAKYHLDPTLQTPIFLTFMIAFAIKSALFPFHTWLPDVYTESETSVTVIMSSTVSKMGVFGFIRVCMPLFPDAMQGAAFWLSVLAVASIIYGALLALAQHNIKRLVACTSISHLGFIVLGIFALNPQGVQGASIQMLNHGITIAALFIIVALIGRRWGTFNVQQLGGFARRTPVLAAVFLLVTMAALGLPGLNGFVGEFMILQGAFRYSGFFALTGGIGVILAAAYMLRLFQGTMHGPGGAISETVAVVRDMTVIEWAQLLPLMVLMVWIGVNPSGWIQTTATMVQTLLAGYPTH